MRQHSSILDLPRELRDLIWDLLAEEEDFTPLIQSCRQLRKEILSRMPGGDLVDYGQPQDDKQLCDQIRGSLCTDMVRIIAEPWYSPGSALKFEVVWRERDDNLGSKTSRWTIRDLSSPMARYIYWYGSSVMSIVFEAPTDGHMLLALLILRAKVFDICRLLKIIVVPSHLHFYGWLNVVFRGGLNLSRPNLVRKSFWEMRPGFIVTKRELRRARWNGKREKKSDQLRDLYPYFYECLMLPLLSSRGAWDPCAVEFDLPPASRHSSFRHQAHGSNYEYLGYKKLLEVAVRKIQYHMQDWGQQDEYGGAFDHVIERLQFFAGDADEFLRLEKGHEADQLRAYLCRTSYGPSCMPFSYASLAASIENPPVIIGGWHCFWEDYHLIRQYLQWATKSELR